MAKKSTQHHRANKVIEEVSAIRRDNLRKLVGKDRRFESMAALASFVGYTESYLNHLLGQRPIRRVTETTARKFEYLLELKVGTLDSVE